jgi:hypothetical protein
MRVVLHQEIYGFAFVMAPEFLSIFKKAGSVETL